MFNKWISCKYKLPLNDGVFRSKPVLVVMPQHSKKIHIATLYYDNIKGIPKYWYSNGWKEELSNVTYWQELPKLPKKIRNR